MSKQEKNRPRTGLSVGICSILVIFVLLCLVTFAVLSLVSARADKALSEKNLQHVTDYYTAETAAYARLAEIDELLAENRTAEQEAYLDGCESALQAAGFTTRRTEKDLFVDYACPVTDRQQLTVSLRVICAEPSAEPTACYSIECWAVESEGDWQPADGLPVYGTGALPTI